VLTSTGKGSDIMVPMAIPSFGGMILQVMTMFVVPILYSMWREGKLTGPVRMPGPEARLPDGQGPGN
jgi:Cu(I)/Ag(I) efflux system membrane protein CusA/SilA